MRTPPEYHPYKKPTFHINIPSNLKIIEGDIFKSNCRTLVNTINCVGVMGKGIALEFKNRYPQMFIDYKSKCDKGLVQIGQPYVWKDPNDFWDESKHVLNFPTKNDWRYPSELRFIIQGLEYFVEHYKDWNLNSIAFCQLGCSNGGLTWDDVFPVMKEYLSGLEIPVEIYIHKE